MQRHQMSPSVQVERGIFSAKCPARKGPAGVVAVRSGRRLATMEMMNADDLKQLADRLTRGDVTRDEFVRTLLGTASAELGLPMAVYATRAEDVLEVSTFDTLVARALAPLSKVLTFLSPHWDAFDELLLIKGPAWVQERADARHQGLMHGLELRRAATYRTPQTDAESVILKIERSGTTV